MNQILMKLPPQSPIHYTIHIGENFLQHPGQWLPDDYHNKKIVIITDDTVSKLYGLQLSSALAAHKPLLLSFAAGEQSKSASIKQTLDEKMIEHHCTRQTLILALGGGVVGDMAGFVASTYMRGIPYIQIPTTLLSMVDSSVGGKTGINTSQGKNLIGAFWQPQSVIADINCLASLPQTHIINGLVEAIKMFLTNNKIQFETVTQHLDHVLAKNKETLISIVQQAVKIKADIVMADEKENHQRMILNFGHTIGHAIEKVMNYNLLHGYAVALGILVEAKISQLSGLLSADEYQIIKSLFSRLEIMGNQLQKMSAEQIIQATKFDKKIASSEVRYVLLKNIGEVYVKDNQFVHPVADKLVERAIREVMKF